MTFGCLEACARGVLRTLRFAIELTLAHKRMHIVCDSMISLRKWDSCTEEMFLIQYLGYRMPRCRSLCAMTGDYGNLRCAWREEKAVVQPRNRTRTRSLPGATPGPTSPRFRDIYSPFGGFAVSSLAFRDDTVR